MTGHIKVKRLNKKGVYRSPLDYDRSFIDADNPQGYFKIVIEPITNFDCLPEIRYMKSGDGYIVSGEAYIISEGSEKEIDSCTRKNHRDSFPGLIQTEVFKEEDLW